MVSLWAGRTPYQFSARLLGSWSTPPVYEAIPTQGRNLLFVELHEFPVIPFCNLVEVPLNGKMTLVYQPLLLVLYHLCCSVIQVINEAVTQDWPRSNPWSMQLVSGPQLDFVFLIPTHRAQKLRQFSVSLIAHCLISTSCQTCQSQCSSSWLLLRLHSAPLFRSLIEQDFSQY